MVDKVRLGLAAFGAGASAIADFGRARCPRPGSELARGSLLNADDPGDGIGCNGMSVLVPMAIGVEVEAPAVGAPVGAEGLVKIDEGDVVLARQIGREPVQDERLADIF